MRLDVAFNDPRTEKHPQTIYPCVELRTLVRSFSGGTPCTTRPEFWGGDIPWVSPKDFGEFHLNDAIDKITSTALDEAGLRLAPKNSVLVVVRSGVLAHTLPIALTTRPMAINQDIKALTPHGVDGHYLALYLEINGKKLLPLITKHSTTVQSINSDQFETLPIPLPPPDIQQSIVTDLEAARAARKQKLAEADALLAGVDGFVLQQLGLIVPQEEKRLAFAIRLGQCKGGRTDALYNAPHFLKVLQALESCPHKKVLLGTLSPEIAGGATPTRGDADLYADEGIKFLRILNIAPFEVVLNDLKHIQESVNDGELARSKLAANDVLMTITGRVGTAAVVLEETLPANINQHIVRLRIQGNNCLPEYLAAWLNSSIGNVLSNRGVTGGTRIALDYETIRNLLIPLPPLSIQQTITAEVTRRREQARRLRDAANTGWQAAKARFEAQLLGELKK